MEHLTHSPTLSPSPSFPIRGASPSPLHTPSPLLCAEGYTLGENTHTHTHRQTERDTDTGRQTHTHPHTHSHTDVSVGPGAAAAGSLGRHGRDAVAAQGEPHPLPLPGAPSPAVSPCRAGTRDGRREREDEGLCFPLLFSAQKERLCGRKGRQGCCPAEHRAALGRAGGPRWRQTERNGEPGKRWKRDEAATPAKGKERFAPPCARLRFSSGAVLE